MKSSEVHEQNEGKLFRADIEKELARIHRLLNRKKDQVIMVNLFVFFHFLF